MLKGILTPLGKSLRVASTAVCLAAALAGSHAMVGQLRLARTSSDASETPVEELRHEVYSSVARRDATFIVQVASPLPTFKLPRITGRQEASSASERCSLLCPLSGGQHTLRNGLGAPLLT